MKQRLLTLVLYFVVYTRLDPICLLHASGKQETACCLTKQSKIIYHDKSYSFETDFGSLIRFNGKKKHLKHNILFY